MDNKVIEVPLSILRVNPWQPRNVEGHIVPEALVESIRKHGLLQVPVGRIVKNGHGDLVQVGDGWQRWQAFVKLSQEDPEKYGRLPVMIRDLGDQEMADLAVESNEKRNNLNPIELATFFRRYMADFKVTQEELGAKFSMSQPAIANALRLLNLQPGVQALVISQEISPTHGRSLLRIEDPKQQAELARWAADVKPTVAQLDSEVLRALKDNMRGLSKNAWPQPEFNVKACEGCANLELFQEMQWTGGKNQVVDTPYCKDPKCWDRKQQSAVDKKKAAEQKGAQKAIDSNPDCVPLDKLGHDAYARFDDKPYPDCKACKDLKHGTHSYSSRPEEVCTNPTCYRNKKRNKTMLQNRFASQQWEHRREHILASVDMNQPLSGPLCQVLIDQLADYWQLGFLDEALGIGKQGDQHARVRETLPGEPLEFQRQLLLQLILESYHQADRYSQRGDAVTRAMVMLLGKQKADEIDAGFVPDMKKPMKAKAEGTRKDQARCESCQQPVVVGQRVCNRPACQARRHDDEGEDAA